MLVQKGFERRAADFLFALEDKLHVAVHKPLAHHILEGFGLYHRLPLVVISPAGIETTVADVRLPRIGMPLVQRLHRHDIIVRIDEDGRDVLACLDIGCVLGINKGIAVGGHHLGFLTTCRQQQFAPTLGTTQHICLMLRLATDTRNTDKTRPLLVETGAVFGNVGTDTHGM